MTAAAARRSPSTQLALPTRTSAWAGVEHAPSVESIRLSSERVTHVLDGDASGGGHRHGTGIAGKTEFPARWGDGLVRANLLDVARFPDVIEEHQNNGRWRVNGKRDGVTVVAIVQPDGEVVTGWPKPGGDGVVKNPEEGE